MVSNGHSPPRGQSESPALFAFLFPLPFPCSSHPEALWILGSSSHFYINSLLLLPFLLTPMLKASLISSHDLPSFLTTLKNCQVYMEEQKAGTKIHRSLIGNHGDNTFISEVLQLCKSSRSSLHNI